MKPYKNEFVVCGVYVTLKQIIQMWSIFQNGTIPYHSSVFQNGWEKIQLWSLGQKRVILKTLTVPP